MTRLHSFDECVFGLADHITRPVRERKRGDLAIAHIHVADLLRSYAQRLNREHQIQHLQRRLDVLETALQELYRATGRQPPQL